MRGLPAVFDTDRRPWILPSGASADAIAAVIEKCPSGALHYTRRDGGAAETPPEQTTITPVPGGPLYVRGLVQLRAADGSLLVEDTRLALCRCGQSRTSRSVTTATSAPASTTALGAPNRSPSPDLGRGPLDPHGPTRGGGVESEFR